MDYTVFDAETDGLYDEVTLIRCLSWWRSDGTKGTITDPAKIPMWASQQNILVGHNIKRYDIPVLKKVLGLDIFKRMIDTLALSWYLHPEMKKHGLETWGDILGFTKPPIADWKNLTLAEYIFRCESDVEINKRLFQKFVAHLLQIYNGMSIDGIMDYVTYKLECASEQEHVKLKINREHCLFYLEELTVKISEKYNILQSVMPRLIKYKENTKPAKMYKKPCRKFPDGEISVAGAKWLEFLFDHNLSPTHEDMVLTEDSNEPGNPNSVPQLKKWLFDMGWQPTLFKYEKTAAGGIRAVPQISDKEGNICLNIQSMFERYPYLEQLESFSMLKHRHGVFKGFLESANEDGFMKAEVDGFTNTLRFKHRKPIANLPGVGKPYGKEIRGAIIIPDDNHVFCGSDMSSLEDSTKQHYMYYYDPEYVKTMRVPGFDPHVDICVLANLVTKEDEDFYKWYNKTKKEDEHHPFTEEEEKRMKFILTQRKTGKTTNFAGVYGAGPPKISLTSGMSLEKSTIMHTIYWVRNKAVKLVAGDVTVRVIFKSGEIKDYLGKYFTRLGRDGSASFLATVEEMWLFNPVSKFWYSLRYPKDIFSTLNQGTGVYCFDTWIRYVRSTGIRIGLQYHDEIGFPLIKNCSDEVKTKLNWSIDQVNNELKLNVPLGISIDMGTNYADCH